MADKKRRRKGSGSLSKSKGGWRLRYNDPITGKQVQKSLGTASKAEADIKAKAIMLELDKWVDNDKLLLDDVFDTYRALPLTKAISEKALIKNRGYHKRFLRFITELNAESKPKDRIKYAHEVNHKVASKFYRVLLSDENIKSDTQNSCIASLKRSWDKLKKDCGLLEPWTEWVPRTNDDTIPKRPLSQLEVKALIDATDDFEIKLMITLGATTGLRLKDVCLLKWGCIDYDKGTIEVVTHKTKKKVYIPILRMLEDTLDKLPMFDKDTESGDDYILPNIAKRYNSYNGSMTLPIKTLFKNAGVHDNDEGTAGFHSLRKTFVSLCAKEGIDVGVIKMVVGHSNEAMTQYYTYRDQETMYKAFGGLVKGGKSKIESIQSKPSGDGWVHREDYHNVSPDVLKDMSILPVDIMIGTLDSMTADNWEQVRDKLKQTILATRIDRDREIDPVALILYPH